MYDDANRTFLHNSLCMEQIMPLILLSLRDLHTQNTLRNKTFIPVSIFSSHVLRLMIRIISTVFFMCKKSQSLLIIVTSGLIPTILSSNHHTLRCAFSRKMSSSLTTTPWKKKSSVQARQVCSCFLVSRLE